MLCVFVDRCEEAYCAESCQMANGKQLWFHDRNRWRVHFSTIISYNLHKLMEFFRLLVIQMEIILNL